ncbi:putative porin [Paraburkholderia youngii]|uniref:porin n=1 Tax=Paraburkholderia youngii TaxID=2782701 RepID=UPI003D230220
MHNSANDGSVYEASAGVQYRFTPALATGASYLYMKGNSVVDNNHGHQVAAIVDYSLSKRTTVYVMRLYQRASSGGFAQINGMNSANGASSGQTQAIARVGLHTHF